MFHPLNSLTLSYGNNNERNGNKIAYDNFDNVVYGYGGGREMIFFITVDASSYQLQASPAPLEILYFLYNLFYNSVTRPDLI